MKENSNYSKKKIKKISTSSQNDKNWDLNISDNSSSKEINDNNFENNKSFKTEETKENILIESLFENLPLCPKDHVGEIITNQFQNLFEDSDGQNEEKSLRIISDDLFLIPNESSDEEEHIYHIPKVY